MSLLELSPEAARLRRIARAWAAGEISRSEYRRARRRLIAEFMGLDAPTSELTAPRMDLEVTQRREMLQQHLDQEPSEKGIVWVLLTAMAAGVAVLSLTLLTV